jgi:hypothetical protein
MSANRRAWAALGTAALIAAFGAAGTALRELGRAVAADKDDAKKDEPKKAEPPPPKLVTKAYDVHEIARRMSYKGISTLIAPPTSAMRERSIGPGLITGWVNGGAALRAAPSPGPHRLDRTYLPAENQDGSIRNIEELIKCLDPETFAEGRESMIRGTYGTLLVTTTDENHARIAALMADLRKAMPKSLAVTARWVLLAPGELDAVSSAGKTAEGDAVRLVDVGKLKPEAVRHAGFASCLNGQTALIGSGRVRSGAFTSRANVCDGPTAPNDPLTMFVQDGPSLELTATLSPDGTAAVVELESVVSEWRDKDAPAPAGPRKGEFDRLDMIVQQLHTTAVVAVGRPTLVGGLTLSARTSDAAPDGRQLYLVLEVVGGK